LCFSYKVAKAVQTVKLTLYHRAETLRARYTDVDPSNEPNRPHISSDIKFSNSVETKETEMRPNFLARPASNTSNSYPPRDPNIRVSAAVRPVWHPSGAFQRRR
ncbi:hypothetical protein, partial [Sulfitobacter sp. HI0054]|uniref:hypothetical protein n=2 Tax=Sulfitobacter TaxID=60136 RepID=UPI0009EF50EE